MSECAWKRRFGGKNRAAAARQRNKENGPISKWTLADNFHPAGWLAGSLQLRAGAESSCPKYLFFYHFLSLLLPLSRRAAAAFTLHENFSLPIRKKLFPPRSALGSTSCFLAPVTAQRTLLILFHPKGTPLAAPCFETVWFNLASEPRLPVCQPLRQEKSDFAVKDLHWLAACARFSCFSHKPCPVMRRRCALWHFRQQWHKDGKNCVHLSFQENVL